VRRFLRFPTMFYVEPTNDCNLNCIMCARKKSLKEVGYMSFEMFSDVVDQLSSRNIAQLSLHLLGEPLLHPQIAEMASYAKSRGLQYVRFATNATLLDEGTARSLVESGLDSLTISMDTSSAERYCPSRKGQELFANLDQNILRLIELKKQRGSKFPEVHMQIIDMKSTQDLVSGFVEKWEGVADRVTVKRMLSWSGHIRIPNKRPPRRLICVNHLIQGVIQWDGDASFCCVYVDSQGNPGAVLGNVAHESLEDIFLGEKRRRIIEAQLRGDYDAVPYCKRCPDWRDFLNRVQVDETSDL